MNKKIKERIITSLLDELDIIYIHALPHDELIIGKRGLVGQEVEHGIILAFGSFSSSNLSFYHNGLSASLQFAGVWEDVFIPFDAIYVIVDDLREPSFMFNFKASEKEKNSNKSNTRKKSKTIDKSGKVINVDFKKKNK